MAAAPPVTPCHERSKATTSKPPVWVLAIRSAASFDSPPVESGSTRPFQPETRLGEALLVPTKFYVNSTLAAHRRNLIKAMAHITGGGFYENLPRVLPEELRAVIDGAAWRPPAVFGWLSQIGGIATDEMARTFNCGLGMLAVVAREDVDDARQVLTEAGETVHVVGEVRKREAGGPAVVIEELRF